MTEASPVAFVVDDMASIDPWRPRAVMVQGRGEALEGEATTFPGSDDAIIRIVPEKVVSWGLDTGPDPSRRGVDRGRSRKCRRCGRLARRCS